MEVTETFKSSSQHRKELPRGTIGKVTEINGDGHAFLDFESGIGRARVDMADFDKLRVKAPTLTSV